MDAPLPRRGCRPLRFVGTAARGERAPEGEGDAQTSGAQLGAVAGGGPLGYDVAESRSSPAALPVRLVRDDRTRA